MTRYATVKEQDQAAAAILVRKMQDYVRCEDRRWYVWDERADPTDIGTRPTPYRSRIYRENEALPRRLG